MIYVIVRLILVAIGVFFAIGYYADALPYRHGAPLFARRQTRWNILMAFTWTVVAAIGVVGWRS